MSNRFKPFVLVCCLFIASFGLFSLDYGVVIDSRSSVDLEDGSDAEFTPREKVSIWMENRWTSGDTIYTLSGNLYYLYNEDEDHVIEPDLLKLSVKQKGFLGTDTVMDAAFGRFSFSDTTGMVLSHVADGVRGRFDLGGYAFLAGIGYTGLQLKPEANVSMTGSDFVDETDDDVYFAPKRLFEQFRLEMPALDRGKKYTIEGIVQQDLRDDSDTLDSLHLTGAAEGRLTENIYFDASVTNAMDLSDRTTGIMAKTGLYYSIEKLLYSRLSGGFLWGTADFFPISEPTIGTIYSPGLTDVTRVNIDYSMRPWADYMSPVLRNLQFVVGGNYFASAGDYTGTEIVGKIRMRPSSDFGAGLTTAAYIPDDGDVQGLIRLDVSIGL